MTSSSYLDSCVHHALDSTGLPIPSFVLSELAGILGYFSFSFYSSRFIIMSRGNMDDGDGWLNGEDFHLFIFRDKQVHFKREGLDKKREP